MQCTAITKSGQPCKKQAIVNSRFCSIHQNTVRGGGMKRSCCQKGCGTRLRQRSYGGGRRTLSGTDLAIAKETYDYYMTKFATLSPDKFALFSDELDNAGNAIAVGDIKSAVRFLADVYNITSEHGFLDQRVKYPGPGRFKQLSHYLDE